jgi:N-methylhydantoinase A
VVEALRRRFREEHERTYGYSRPGRVLIVGLRLRATVAGTSTPITELTARIERTGSDDGRHVRDVYFGRQFGTVAVSVRGSRDIGGEESGPLILEEEDTTVVVPPQWRVRKDEYENLVLSRPDSSAAPA